MSLFVVTGGAGFIGSHLVDALLASGHAVRVIDDLSTGRCENLDPRAALIRADIADAAALDAALAGAEGCFHLAAIASVARTNVEWANTHRINQGGAVAVFDAARRAGAMPVVYASSAAVYGDQGGVPARESARPAPLTAYGADKLGSELHAAVGWRIHGLPSVGLRFFNVYGARQDAGSPYSGVISRFAARVAAGQPLALHGGGAQVRDFVAVADVVGHLRAAMRHASRHGGAEIANVCTGRPTSIRDLADSVCAAAGRTVGRRTEPARDGDIAFSLGAPAYATRLLGVRAETTLDEGLRALIGPKLAVARAA